MPTKTILQAATAAANIAQFTLSQSSTGAVEASVTYQVRDALNNPIGGSRSLSITLTPSQQATLIAFFNAQIVPLINSAEGT